MSRSELLHGFLCSSWPWMDSFVSRNETNYSLLENAFFRAENLEAKVDILNTTRKRKEGMQEKTKGIEGRENFLMFPYHGRTVGRARNCFLSLSILALLLTP
jgi:hypothetical protein